MILNCLSVCLSISLCLSVFLSVSLYRLISLTSNFPLSVSLSVCLSVYLLSVWPCVCLSRACASAAGSFVHLVALVTVGGLRGPNKIVRGSMTSCCYPILSTLENSCVQWGIVKSGCLHNIILSSLYWKTSSARIPLLEGLSMGIPLVTGPGSSLMIHLWTTLLT